MTGSNKELIAVLEGIRTQLDDMKHDLADIRREMPKVPYYGDLLQDIVKAIQDLGN
jgi:Tfp pilus assembly protein PilO